MSLERILGGGLRIGVLRGLFYDTDGEEAGATWDEIDFHPDGTLKIVLNTLHGEMTDKYKET